MKIAIVYSSVHHGNTKKILEEVKQEIDVDLIQVQEVGRIKLDEYDVIGLASGIYMGKFHNKILEFIDKSKVLGSGKKVFLILTSGRNGKKYGLSEKSMLENKGCQVLGIYKCKGYDTYAFLKYIGGISKGHPNDEEISEAINFVKKIY